RAVMKIVIPDTVEIVAPSAARPNQFPFLSFILRHQYDGTLTCSTPCSSADRPENVLFRSVENAFRRVETKSVEMKFIDPVATIGDEKFTHRTGVRSVEIDRIAPIILVLASQIIVGINAEIIPVRAKMIV